MNHFLIDENLPRSLAPALQKLGYEAKDVRDLGLRGKADSSIYEHAQRNEFTIVTSDLGFADESEFPLESHWGVVIVRIPSEVSAKKRVEEIIRAIKSLNDAQLEGTLVVVSPGKVRIRRMS